MADAIALIDDLFFQAKVREAAKHTGATIEIATTGERLLKAAAASPEALILVDLNAREGALDAVERLCAQSKQARAPVGSSLLSARPAGEPEGNAGGPDARGNPRRVIAFLSHVQTDLAERARAAGCDEVMPRSKFTQNLAEILHGAKR